MFDNNFGTYMAHGINVKMEYAAIVAQITPGNPIFWVKKIFNAIADELINIAEITWNLIIFAALRNMDREFPMLLNRHHSASPKIKK